ncbi:MAG TPA: hypothetical protein VN033_00115 [Vulgatibacter sp.]|nr:hypothetical protein [Vulgatibacter sp.]
MRAPSYLFAALVLLVGCGDAAVTDGREVAFTLAAESMSAGEGGPPVIVTRTGWTVTLEEAAVAIGPVYLLTEPPPSARRGRLLDWIVPRAWAHSGFEHFDGGEVRGEYLGRFVIDAVRPGLQAIAAARGLAGRVRSVNLELQPPAADAPSLRGHQAFVRGIAARGDETIPFEGGLDLPDAGAGRKVAGIPADVELDDGVTVVIELHPERWLAEADFSALPAPPGGDERRRIAPGTQPHDAWALGVRAYGTFTLRGERP